MKTFRPPFRIEVDFYDANGEMLEWHECWGDCPDAAEVRYCVVDIDEQILSTHNTREKAEAALAKITAALKPQGESPCQAENRSDS